VKSLTPNPSPKGEGSRVKSEKMAYDLKGIIGNELEQF